MNVVYLTDEGIDYEHSTEHFQTIADWARTHCSSFVDYELEDVSDVSLQYDYVAEYRFNDPKDVTLFTLRWK